MKKLVAGLIYLLAAVVVIAVFLTACAGPSISVESSAGFTHVTSVRVPFNPPDDSVASLQIDDEGTAVFIKYIEIFHGHVNPQKEYWREIYTIDKHGIVETKEFGPFEAIRRLDPSGDFVALDNGDNVAYVDVLSLTSRSVVDSDLADIIRNQYSADYYDSGLVVYKIPVPEKPGSEKGVVIYDTSTHQEIRVDFQEEYVSIDTIDFDGGNILIKANESNHKPPVLYVLDVDGTIKLKLTLSHCEDPYSDDTRLVPGGLVVAASDITVVDSGNATNLISRASVLKRYSFDGTEEWSCVIPVTGFPRLKWLSSTDDGVLVLVLVDHNDLTSFIGYFTDEDGEEVYTNTFQGEYDILSLDNSGSYYIYPEWSLYPEIPPPSGKIALFNYSNELASLESGDDIYYFAASPSGKFFAVVTDGTISIFSKAE